MTSRSETLSKPKLSGGGTHAEKLRGGEVVVGGGGGRNKNEKHVRSGRKPETAIVRKQLEMKRGERGLT